MGCEGCVDIVSNALSEAPGVESVSVDLDSGLAAVDGEADVAELRRKVEFAGYEAEILDGEDEGSEDGTDADAAAEEATEGDDESGEDEADDEADEDDGGDEAGEDEADGESDEDDGGD